MVNNRNIALSDIAIPENARVFPAFSDCHVHLREPGFEYKETIKTGTLAAAHGGYGSICSMPNLNPVPDTPENLKVQLDIISRDAVIDVTPIGAITCGEKGEQLSDMRGLSQYVCGFSDDGHGVASRELMRDAMELAKTLDKPIIAHSEDLTLLNKGWCVNLGAASERFSLIGNDGASEWRQVERDLKLVSDTGCKYHLCHISTRESVELIRAAKRDGLDVTCETAPHYLVLCEDDLKDDGSFRMNPPIRSRRDRDALLEGVCDGTIDMVSTDHAPHSANEKSGGLANSLNGIVGLECAFPVLYTALVKTNVITLARLLELFTKAAQRFNLPVGDDVTVYDLDSEYSVDTGTFFSKGKSTPFAGMSVYGKCLATIHSGKIVYNAIGGDRK